MPKLNRKAAIIAGAFALVALIGAAIWGAMRPKQVTQNLPATVQGVSVAAVGLSAAPYDVQEAAARLMHSRVGYAIPKADRTYLIISTGSDSLRVQVDGAEGQPASGTPSLVDVNLSSSGVGDRLLVLTVPLTGEVEYQFNLDGAAASIPTLHNRHGLALVTLPDAARFVVLRPASNQLLTDRTIDVRGYARVFEAQFTVRAVSAKGRVLGEQHVMAAAGAPSWGSFVAQLTLTESDLPETGFLIFEEGQTEAKLVVPVRFRTPPQMG